MSKNLVLENVRIMFRNFEGREDKFNRAGDRNFAVLLDPETAENLLADGWNVKSLKPRDEYDEPAYYIPVSVIMNDYTTAKLVTKKNILVLNEDTVGMLDSVDLETCDIVLRPYDWEVHGNHGRKAYLKTIYAVVREDDFADKYDRDYPSGPIVKKTIFIPAKRR